MNKIPVAVDGSKHSEEVLEYASELVKKSAAKIILAHSDYSVSSTSRC
jgi:nucleotide-binding universal stress UspA family protein